MPQESNGLTEEYESCSCIYRYGDHISKCKDKYGVDGNRTNGGGFNTMVDGCNKDTDWDCDEWNDGDSERSDTPHHPLEIRGERKVPACTMNAAENGGKGQQEEDMIIKVIRFRPRSRTVEHRNVGGIDRENDGSNACHIGASGGNDSNQKKGKFSDKHSDS